MGIPGLTAIAQSPLHYIGADARRMLKRSDAEPFRIGAFSTANELRQSDKRTLSQKASFAECEKKALDLGLVL